MCSVENLTGRVFASDAEGTFQMQRRMLKSIRNAIDAPGCVDFPFRKDAEEKRC
jgi:hypothetical protein